MKKILVVDDNKMNLKIAKKVLAGGYEIVLAESGEAAIRYLQDHTADMILLDILMPQMDGYETLEKIRQIGGMGDVPVIFLTAETDDEVRARSAQAGAKDIVQKPFKKEELLAKVEEHL